MTTLTNPLCINNAEVQINATGVYDADTGALIAVQIDGAEVPTSSVELALRLLGVNYDGWADDLDEYKLTELLDADLANARADAADDRRAA